MRAFGISVPKSKKRLLVVYVIANIILGALSLLVFLGLMSS